MNFRIFWRTGGEVAILLALLAAFGCNQSRVKSGPSYADTPTKKRGAVSPWTSEQNLFKPLPLTPKTTGKSYRWTYQTLSGDTIALDEIWEVSPVLLVFFEYGAEASHEAFRQAFLLDAEFGTILKVVGLNLYDEGRKMDDDELAGRLGELVSNVRYREELKSAYDYAGMLGMAIVQLHRHDALLKTFGKTGSGSATLIGFGGKVIYEGLRGQDIYIKSADYLRGLFESQKYRVADFGMAPRLRNAPARKALWVVWMPDSLPSLEALKMLNTDPEEARGWELALMTLAPKKLAEDVLKKIGGRMAKQQVIPVTSKEIQMVFGTDDLFLPGLAVVGEDGHLWYLGSGEWTAEDLKRILTEVSAKAGRTGEAQG
jgi:hypothetical protein